MDRRHFALGSAAGLLALGGSGCARGGPDAYESAQRKLRAPLPAEPALVELVRYATLAANGHNTQPWKFAATARGVRIVPDFTRRTPVVDPDDHHLYVSLGCAAENLLIAAAARGLAGAVALAGGVEGLEIELTAAPAVDDGLLAAIPLRQSTRSLYDGRPVPLEQLRELEQAARVAGVSLRLITAPSERDAVTEFVIRGNGMQMDDPAFVAELRDWIRFSAEDAVATGDGLYSASSGNPTLPGWLGRRLFPLVFRKSAENEKYAAQIASSAGIAVFTADRADAEHWMRVGRSFERFALRATALGIRHAHINQPVEVPQLRRDFARWLGAPDARPDLVVRFGHAAPLPMSLRRSAMIVT
jgi:hypothetical protein